MDEKTAALIVIETITAMAGEGLPMMTRVVPQDTVVFWEHYPDNDARDERTRSRWYYHAHAPVQRDPGQRDPGEHGHFHLFLHRTQLDDRAAYTVAPAEGEEAAAHVTHIAGLSINHAGVPVAWFATNRWVTDEFLYPAQTMIAHLDRYDVDQTGADPLVNRLLTAMVALYRNELEQLLLARDAAMAPLVAAQGTAAYEAGHAMLATIPIDLDAKIESLDL